MSRLSDHFDGRRFFNPTPPEPQPFSAVPRMLLERRTPWPARIDVPLRRPPSLDGAAAVITFIGHATFLIQTAAGNILTGEVDAFAAGHQRESAPQRSVAIDLALLPIGAYEPRWFMRAVHMNPAEAMRTGPVEFGARS